jgi:hypothetical protein
VKKSNSSVKKGLFFTLSSVRKSRFDKENSFLHLIPSFVYYASSSWHAMLE